MLKISGILRTGIKTESKALAPVFKMATAINADSYVKTCLSSSESQYATKSLEDCIAIRDRYKGTLSYFKNFLSNLDLELTTVSFIRLKLKSFTTVYDKYNAVQSYLEKVNPSMETSEDRNEFEQNFKMAVTQAEEIIEKLIPRAKVSPPIAKVAQIPLPELELPKFGGNPEEWLQFYQTFCSLVDSNNRISTIQKFCYLRSLLVGEASKLLSPLSITKENYSVAISLLKETYYQPNITLQKYIRGLFNLKMVKSEDPTALSDLLYTAQDYVRGLEYLKEPVQHWDTILIYLVVRKLDPVTKRAWYTETVVRDDKILFSELVDFIKRRCAILTAIGLPEKRPIFTKGTKLNPPNEVSNAVPYKICTICNLPHSILRCAEFRRMTVEDRRKHAQDNKLCSNCLGHHSSSKCLSKRNCTICQQKHNSLLHQH